MSDKPKAINHEISVELARLIPEEVRVDSELLESYVNRALDIGLRAMVSASGSIDLTYVSKEFDTWKNEVSSKLIGENSDFEQGLDHWFENSDGSFQKAFDLDDPKSPLSKFMVKQKTDRGTHEKAMNTLVNEIKDLVSKDAAPKQAKQMGDDFEDDIEWFLTNIKSAEDEVKRTGEEAVEGSGGDKKGDVLVEVGHPSTDDLKITIEAKAGKSQGAYTLEGAKSIWNQMSTSMSLRKAQASIGVVDINNVKQHKSWIDQGRYKILVAVDWESMDFTLLEIAYNVLRFRIIQDLSIKEPATAEPKLDIARFNELIEDISSNSDIIRTMRTNVTKIGSICTEQDAQITNWESAIQSQVKQLKMLIEHAESDEDE